MDKIPEDIMHAAREVMDDISLNDASATPAIARAILAERKRCAEVARGEAHADCNVAEQIAAAIEALP